MAPVTRVLPMGERALLVELPSHDDVLACYALMQQAPLPHQLDLVPGAESLLIVFDRPVPPATREVVGRMQPYGVAPSLRRGDNDGQTAPITIDVRYDGPDLAEVARHTGLAVDDVIAAHTATDWRVGFCGFAPGFGYLIGDDPRLAVPRRSSPRSEVPAGAVGLAGRLSGIYPRPSPGGWQLIGRTDAALWDLERDPPALLRPGLAVRFRSVREIMTIPTAVVPHTKSAVSPRGQAGQPTERHQDAGSSGAATDLGTGARSITVIRPGVQCLIQDLGRPGWASMGVSPSGVADRAAARSANRAVGNDDNEAVLEILLGGAAFRAEDELLIAIAGAPVTVTVDPAEAGDPGAALNPMVTRSPELSSSGWRGVVPAGATLRLGRATQGLRCYLAVAGGIAAPAVLGSRATDLLGRIGPEPLRAGQRIPLGRAARVGAGAPDRAGAAFVAGIAAEPAAVPEPAGAPDRAGAAFVAGIAAEPAAVPEPASLPEPVAASAPAGARELAVPPEPAGMPKRAATPGEAGAAEPAAGPGSGESRADAGGVILDLLAGPQADWFDTAALQRVSTEPWTVSPASDRTGVRLTGPAPARVRVAELPSQGLVRGAIQVPPSGELVIVLADHPVTGGYPVIAVLTEESADRAAQLRPGQIIGLRMRDMGG